MDCRKFGSGDLIYQSDVPSAAVYLCRFVEYGSRDNARVFRFDNQFDTFAKCTELFATLEKASDHVLVALKEQARRQSLALEKTQSQLTGLLSGSILREPRTHYLNGGNRQMNVGKKKLKKRPDDCMKIDPGRPKRPLEVTFRPGDKVYFFQRDKVTSGIYRCPTSYDPNKFFVMVNGEQEIATRQCMFDSFDKATWYGHDVLSSWIISCENEISNSEKAKEALTKALCREGENDKTV